MAARQFLTEPYPDIPKPQSANSMIDRFEPVTPLEPEDKDHLQWVPALGAGLVAGFILLIVPGGSPWSALTFFSKVVMGRIIPEGWAVPLLGTISIHVALSVVYGLV